MSKKIGIVSEGVSDYYVLKHIVSRYLKEQDVYTIPLNPKQAMALTQQIQTLVTICSTMLYRLLAECH